MDIRTGDDEWAELQIGNDEWADLRTYRHEMSKVNGLTDRMWSNLDMQLSPASQNLSLNITGSLDPLSRAGQ